MGGPAIAMGSLETSATFWNSLEPSEPVWKLKKFSRGLWSLFEISRSFSSLLDFIRNPWTPLGPPDSSRFFWISLRFSNLSSLLEPSPTL